MTALTRDRVETIRAMAARGASAHYICAAFQITKGQLRKALRCDLGESLPSEPHEPMPGETDSSSPKFADNETCAAAVLAYGGYPRAECVNGKTVWLDWRGNPWREVRP